MKTGIRIIGLSLIIGLVALQGMGETTLMLPLGTMTGSEQLREITITPLDGAISYNGVLYNSGPVTVRPVAGGATNAWGQPVGGVTTNLNIGGNVRLTWRGLGRAVQIYLPFGVPFVNAADPAVLRSGILQIWNYTNWAAAGTNSGTPGGLTNNDSRAVSLLNPSNQVAGSFSGDGRQLQISGTNLAPGTVSSNALDEATRALLGGVGAAFQSADNTNVVWFSGLSDTLNDPVNLAPFDLSSFNGAWNWNSSSNAYVSPLNACLYRSNATWKTWVIARNDGLVILYDSGTNSAPAPKAAFVDGFGAQPVSAVFGTNASITGLNASALSSGTVPLARLPTITSNQIASVDASQVSGLVPMAVTNTDPGLRLSGPTRFVFVGDSLTAGTFNINYLTYPYWLTNAWKDSRIVLATNLAVGGSTIYHPSGAATLTNGWGVVSSFAPRGGTNAWLFVWSGINDLYFGASADSIIAEYSNYLAKAHAAGFSNIVFTVTDRNNFGSPTTQEQARAGVNAWIRQTPLADVVVDVASLFPTFDPGTSYQVDGVHFTANAHAYIARVVQSSLITPIRAQVPATLTGTNLQLFGAAIVNGPVQATYLNSTGDLNVSGGGTIGSLILTRSGAQKAFVYGGLIDGTLLVFQTGAATNTSLTLGQEDAAHPSLMAQGAGMALVGGDRKGSGTNNLTVSGFGSFTNSLFLPTNTIVPSPLPVGGWLWNSNQCVYWVTSTKTNLLSDGR
jgi:hypothetical protein